MIANSNPLRLLSLKVRAIGAVCAALAVGGCVLLGVSTAVDHGDGSSSFGHLAAQGEAIGAGWLAAPEARVAQRFDVVYSIPPKGAGSADGTVRYRQLDASSLATAEGDALIGAFTGVEQFSSNAVDPGTREVLVSQDIGGAIRRFAIDEGKLNSLGVGFGVGVPVGVVGSDGSLYFIDGTQVVGADGAGRAYAATLPVPQPGTPTLDGKPTKQILLPSASRAAALILTPEGDLVVFVDNSVNGAVVNLRTGARLDLPGYGAIQAAVIGLDGSIYALLSDPSRTANTFALAHIDPIAMTLSDVVDTGIAPRQGEIDGVDLSVGLDGTIYAYVAQESAGSPAQHATLAKFDPASNSLSQVSLPDNIGLGFTTGVDGRLYFFGGLAGPTVTIYDPASGAVDSFKAAPDGSYVRAVFVR